ncbi:MAG: glycoside hydrolase family 92 protein [Dysgonamonadaceae bacterium]|jgi:predicted alpha-1,2-mannosidase|nr:glycoside hydrolase family 92 protein [Dysgonamonadaceae bacterium]
MKNKIFSGLLAGSLLFTLASCSTPLSEPQKSPVDYVNPYMGNISHLLVPTFPTVHLPNSLLRVYPERKDFTSDLMSGLPVIVTSHRGSSAFNISPKNEFWGTFSPVIDYTYDHEKITPYRYSVYLNEAEVQVDFAPSHQSGVYSFLFEDNSSNQLIINTRNGMLKTTGCGVSGYQWVGEAGATRIYLYLEAEQPVLSAGTLDKNEINYHKTMVEGKNKALVLCFRQKRVNVRYGVSFISEEQARKNLKREMDTYSVDKVAAAGKQKWNDALGKISVQGACETDKTVFYTSLYRTYERMICLSEDGRYYSAFDEQIHSDEGKPFYTDDWVWDTYRATHPLRTLIEAEMETDMIGSYIRMAGQTQEGWMPTFPEVTGDSHRMNGNHAVAIVWDAYVKGLRGFDLEAAYNACKGALTEKSLLPWRRIPNTELDVFYQAKGYFPALYPGEEEPVKEVHATEKRQPVAVTLGTCYDDWCLAQIAGELGKTDDYERFQKRSYNYRNLYRAKTGFFHPKDKNGKFIEPFDYRFSGGQGARHYYDENNAWIYRWDVQHRPADLIQLMGGVENFVKNLDRTFREPLGMGKYAFYAQLPDQTGNVGQFSMANEPSLHIPYLYNYAGQPWKTQKRIRELLHQWFRNDLMGVPGDEDGGGMSAFVVFSQMGFYPVTPGLPVYNIGSPCFEKVKVQLGDHLFFEIEAKNSSKENKYIQSAKLNGKKWNKPWFSHDDIKNGGKLELVMGNKANPKWGAQPEDAPPSGEINACRPPQE